MPRYEYKCKKCNKSFEALHGVDDQVDACKHCGGKVRRVFHPVGIVFKGPGFYATDSRKPDTTPSPPAKDGAKATEKASPDGKKEKAGKEKKETEPTANTAS